MDVGDIRPLDPNQPDAPPKPLPNDVPPSGGDSNGVPLTDPKHGGRGDQSAKEGGRGGGGSDGAGGGGQGL